MPLPIIGQEAVCPDGLGRVIGFGSEGCSHWICVETYINDSCCHWDYHNVKLVEIKYQKED